MNNEEIRKIIGQRVKWHRKACALTQAELAAKMGVRRAYISNIEQGQKAISFEKLYELCAFFNIIVSDLFPMTPKDDSEERERIVLEAADVMRTLDTNKLRLIRSIVVGMADCHGVKDSDA